MGEHCSTWPEKWDKSSSAGAAEFIFGGTFGVVIFGGKTEPNLRWTQKNLLSIFKTDSFFFKFVVKNNFFSFQNKWFFRKTLELFEEKNEKTQNCFLSLGSTMRRWNTPNSLSLSVSLREVESESMRARGRGDVIGTAPKRVRRNRTLKQLTKWLKV